MHHTSAMNMAQSKHDLPKEIPGILLIDPSSGLDELQKVPTSHVLHHHEQMLVALKHFQEPYHITVLDLFHDVNFSKDFSSLEIIFHERLFYGFDCYVFPCKLVNTECDGTKRPFAYQLHKLVKLERGHWSFIRGLKTRLDTLNKLLSIFQNLFI
jgi:hypothetical protein